MNTLELWSRSFLRYMSLQGIGLHLMSQPLVFPSASSTGDLRRGKSSDVGLCTEPRSDCHLGFGSFGPRNHGKPAA
jgi:hypothetical protein